MPAYQLFQFLGVFFAASMACVLLEQAAGVHPIVRRAAQIAACIFAGVYIGHATGVLPL